jgi:uncharacterized membrane-anchored protein
VRGGVRVGRQSRKNREETMDISLRNATMALLAVACLAAPATHAEQAAPYIEPALVDEAAAESPVDGGQAPTELSPEQMAAMMEAMQAEQQVLQLNPQQGRIELPNGVTALDVPDSWVYLDPRDAAQVLAYWGNPPGIETEGMLVPREAGLDGPDSWAVVLTYDDSGYVSDKDAASIDYAELLDGMKEESAASNEYRRQEGYATVDLVGWAVAPRYDALGHKLYWAKELAFEGADENTLNYAVRVLGREGVLEMNAVASMGQLGMIERQMPSLIAMGGFVDGQRYEQFDESTDRVAAYGLAALVAGGVAAKTGLWAKLLALLIAGKKIIIPLLIAAALFIPKLLQKLRGKDQAA